MEHRQTEPQIASDKKQWPVSLLGCLQLQKAQYANQESYAWFMAKALLCPAAALGANETLYQEEELADICCLQPRSVCGPTCRDLNSHFCGLGNEGLKLCAHTCLLQAACSCVFMGLPLIAWLTVLQRQRVVAKHAVVEKEEDAWATMALYPCSLLQMHVLLKQQQQPVAGQAAAPYKAPKVQQMVAEPSYASQPTSAPGPLTSAMSTSRVMRAVRTQSAKGAGSRLGDSMSSNTSSGVVDNPYGQKQPELGAEESVMCELEDCSEAAAHVQQQQQQQQQQDERQTTHLLEHCAGGSSSKQPALTEGPLHMGTTCLSARSANGSRHVSPRPSSRGGAPGSGSQPAAASAEQGPLSARRRLHQQQHSQGGSAAGHANHSTRVAGLPPKHRGSASGLPQRPASSGGGTNSTAAAAAGPPGPQPAVSPEPPRCSEAEPAAAAPSQQLNCSASSRHSIQDAAAAAAAAAALGTSASAGGVSGSMEQQRWSAAGGFGAAVGSSGENMSGSRLSVGGSCSSARLQLSQEDVPLMAIKPTPGRMPRGMGTALSSSRGAAGKAGLAGSWQRHSSSDKQLQQLSGSEHGSCSNSNVSSRRESDADAPPAPVPAAATGRVEPPPQQVQPQYATVQSDICNYASWLGGAGVSAMELHADASAASLQRQQSSSQPPSRQDSLQDGTQQEQQLHQQQPAPTTAGFAGQSGSEWRRQQQQPPGGTLTAGLAPDDDQLQPPSRQDSGMVLGSMAAAKVSSSPMTKNKAVPRAGTAGPESVQQSSGILQQHPAAGRGRARMSDWAYMSDLCNLGGSFEANVSTYGAGLAAALGRLAEEGYAGNEDEVHDDAVEAAVGSEEQQQTTGGNTAAAGGGSGSRGGRADQRQQQQCRARAATGSWPDAEPSPPSTLHDTLDSQPASSNGGAEPSAAESPAAPAAADEVEQGSAVSTRKCSSTDGSKLSAADVGSAGQQGQPGKVAKSPAMAAATCVMSPAAAAAEAAAGGPARASRKPLSIDRDMLAAVTGTTGTEQLTASQEELAAKLAKLAFANPAAARRLAGQRAQPQQHVGQQQSSAAAAGGGDGISALDECAGGGDEPFYPTMMSDICNLAEPLDEEEDEEQEKQGGGMQRLLSAAASASAAQHNLLQAVQQGTAGQQRGQQQRSLAGRLQGGPAAAATAAASKPGPLKSALLMRGGQLGSRPGLARQVHAAGAGATGCSIAAHRPSAAGSATPAGAGVGVSAAGARAGGVNSCYTLESFDSYYPDCDLKCSVDAPPNAKGRTFTVTPGGVIIETAGVSQFGTGCSNRGGSSRAASPAAVGAMVSTGVGASPPKSPAKRAAGAAKAANAAAAATGALHCESAAAAADESDVQHGWQLDMSRSASPAVGSAGGEATGSPGGGVGLKGLLGAAAVQTSATLWPVVDASTVAGSGQ